MPAIAQRLATKIFDTAVPHVDKLVCYDDVLLGDSGKSDFPWDRTLQQIEDVCTQVRATLNVSKSQGPSPHITFIGVTINLERKHWTLEGTWAEKVKRLEVPWVGTLRDWAGIVGTLAWGMTVLDIWPAFYFGFQRLQRRIGLLGEAKNPWNDVFKIHRSVREELHAVKELVAANEPDLFLQHRSLMS